MAPIANLFDDFDDGTLDPAKWTVTGGTVTEANGTVCFTTPPSSSMQSVDSWSLVQSSAFLEVVSYLNGAGATQGILVYRLFNSADSTDYVEFNINAFTGNISFQWVENAVTQQTLSVAYNPITMRWLRLRATGTTVFFETSSDGATWANQLSTPVQAWASSVRVRIVANQTNGAATTKCIDNFNVAPASSRIVPVGTEFDVSDDGELGLNRCEQVDEAWGYPCSVSAYNALRRSDNPCGHWVQPPSKQFMEVEQTAVATSSQEETTIISLELTNPDTCRTMQFYLPLTAGMKMNVPDSDDSGIFNWTLGVSVTGVDNSDDGFTPVTANDFGTISGKSPTHFWRGEADYFWTAEPGQTTTVEVKLKVFSGGGDAKVTQLQAHLGIIGMSEVQP